MKPIPRTLLYGFLVWLVPFAVGFSIYKPLHESERDIFENAMALVLVLTTVVCSNRYFRKVESGFVKHGLLAGIVWMAVSLALDLPMFSAGPLKRPVGDYMKDIGMAYLVIPILTTGAGCLLAGRRDPG